MDQAVAKKTLNELIRRGDLKNKVCIDCSNPNPQWASLSFAVFLCLQCAGTHRGFGVHISFVRSVSMDTWQEEQIRRMTLGGNAPFLSFMESYTPVDQGGYKSGSTPHEKYHCWAATQYRSKLDADLAGKPWSPSAPADGAGGTTIPPGRPSSAQGLRKSRTTMQSNTERLRSEHSPGSASNSGKSSPVRSPQLDQKTANESFFAGLGQANAFRPADLPPSQGGKYQGFGNTPSPDPTPGHPSYGLSSHAAPSLNDLQENPMAALSKGWSIFSAAVSGATRVVNENVIQPGLEKAMDPALKSSVRGYVSEAGRRAGDLGKSANEWSKSQFGVDVADQVGGVVETVRDRISGGPENDGYGTVPSDHEGYNDDEDFFKEYSDHQPTTSAPTTPTSNLTSKGDDWNDWKDF